MEHKSETLRIWLGAGAVVVAFAVVLALVIFTAGRQAGYIVAETDRKSISSEIERELERALAGQAEISFWDDTVQMVETGGHEADLFWRDELVDWFTVDLAFEAAVVIDANDQILVAAEDGEAIDASAFARDVWQHRDLIEEARARFDAAKQPAGDGYLAPVSRISELPDIGVAAYRYFSGLFGIVTAQVIVGETPDYAVAADRLFVFLAFSPIDEAYITEFSEGLGLDTRHVVLVPHVPIMPESPHMVPFSNASQPAEMFFHWRPRRMDHLIMLDVAPFAALSFLLLVTALVMPLRAHSKAVALLAKSEAVNRQLANHDALTGLPNRAQFDRKLDRLLADQSGELFAVMCIDLDEFKAVNDRYGHSAGDEVLRTVATRLSKVIGEAGLIARVGGDEFVALINEKVERDYLVWLGDNLIEEATRPIAYQGHQLRVGCSIGVSIWPRDGRTACAIIAAADEYLYESKRGGRGRVTIGGTTLAAAATKKWRCDSPISVCC
ncbi:MAG: diguanylate cyclase [Pseudomonadota bacterium]